MTNPLPDDADQIAIVIDDQSAWLDDVGCSEYAAATVCHPDGSAGLVLAWLRGLDDDTPYQPGPAPEHEDLGPLPIPIMRRLVEVTRAHRAIGTQPEEEIA